MDNEKRNIELIKRFHLTATVGDRCFHNGVEYVDLDLPSGTKWATMNVGAKSIEDGGLYFQWGDTQGYTKLYVDSGKKEFSALDYKYYKDLSVTKYNSEDCKTVLDLEDDAAHVHLGGSWRIPTKEEIKELDYYTYKKVLTFNGINGVILISMKNRSNRIFIPYAGFASYGLMYGIGRFGGIWSSYTNLCHPYDALRAFFHKKGFGSEILFTSRPLGLPIRGVFNY